MMKKRYNFITGLTLVTMVITTLVCAVINPTTYYTNESAEYLTKATSINYFFSWGFIFGLSLLLYKNRVKGALKYFVFILCVIGWGLSGRIVTFKYWPTGKMSSGWYFVKTTETVFCPDPELHEVELRDNTIVNPKPFWSFELVSQYNQETLFVGPIQYQKALKLLREEGLKVE